MPLELAPGWQRRLHDRADRRGQVILRAADDEALRQRVAGRLVLASGQSFKPPYVWARVLKHAAA